VAKFHNRAEALGLFDQIEIKGRDQDPGEKAVQTSFLN